ncbi:MAG: hypothetical protein H6694_09295 [Candidatus Latescibacteria bacterium]|nr:hypothetical protein [bacterium]MCB9514489.1 hypothetical protein [Candidatus Latescibacterota bacterium]
MSKRRIAALFAALALAGAARAEEPDPRYWRLDDVVAQFQQWSVDYPDIFQAGSLGLSGQGEAIPLARISDHAQTDEPEPALLFHAAQHANECNGTGAIMDAMAALLQGYALNPGMRARVDSLELWFMPIFNVDGHRYVFGGGPSWADWRKTLRDNNGNDQVDYPDDGVDTNRNWDWYWDESDETDPAHLEYKGPFPFSEPEATALRDFVLTRRPLVVVDYHSPVTIVWDNEVFWPWLSTHGWGYSPDEPVARDVASQWAAATLTHTGQPFGSIFGYDSLPKEQNWIYGETGILTFVMEISDHCWWTGATVDTIATRVARGSYALIDRAMNGPGIRGRVTDAVTGNPLVAQVEILQYSGAELGPHLTDAAFGKYERLTKTGSFTVQASCPGYETQTQQVPNVTGGWRQVDLALVPTLTAVPDLPSDGLRIVGPNPLRPGQAVLLALGADVTDADGATVELFDVTGRRRAVLGAALAPGATHRLALPADLASGVYLLRASAGGTQAVRRITLLR